MPDYKYTQESGTDWKVNTSDKANAVEDTNEIRAVVDDLGRLLVHSKKDGSFPEDLSTGGTLAIPESLIVREDEQAITTTTGTAAIDWGDGRNAFFTRSTGANGAVTFSFTAPTVSANLSLIIRGSSVGSTGTITWPTVYWQGASVPGLSSGVSAIDKIGLYYSTGLGGYLGDSLTNYSTV